MKPLWSKWQRIPRGIQLLIVGIVVSLIILTVYIPWWPEFAFYMVLLTLFCPNFNVLGGSCGATAWTYVIGWIVLIGLIGTAIFITRQLYRKWQAL